MKTVKNGLFLVLTTLALTCIAIPIVSADSMERQLFAVVVGVNGGDATHLDNNAQDFANVLMTQYGYPSGNVKLLVNSAATKSAVLGALESLRDQESAPDGVSIFISAHGSNDHLYLYDEALRDYELATILSGFESHNILVVIDACHSGSFLDVADALEQGIVVTGCSADEITFDIGFFTNTIFTEYFVDQGMAQGLADGNGDGSVTVQEAFNYAYGHCADPPGAIPSTYPQISDKYGDAYLLSSPIHAPWFSNLMVVLAATIVGYVIATKKRIA